MKNINAQLRFVVFSMLTGFAFLFNWTPVLAQGCDQVEIRYEEPDCYKPKPGAGGTTPNDRTCTPVAACVDQSYTYSVTGGPWASQLWTITSGPAFPAINPGNTAATINITWPVAGTYTLTLTVTDGAGNAYTKCLTVTVRDKPNAGFTFSPNNACAGSTVNFTNTTTFSGTAAYSWNFGDPSSGPNNVSTLTDPTHIYNTAGTYTVTLIAYSTILVPGGGSTTGHGDSLSAVTCCADTFKQTVTVAAGSVSIQCVSTVCAGAIAKYTAVGCTSPTWGTPVGGTIQSTSGNTVTIQWGNGNPQGQISVSCGGGCTAYVSVPIVPSSPVIAGNTSPCSAGTSTYTVPYLPGTYYTWTLTDITTSTNANNLLSTFPDNNTAVINWSAATPGDTYQLSVTLDNKHLCCTSSASLNITPKQKFSISGPTSVCAGQSATFFPSLPGTFNWSAAPVTGVTPPGATGTGFYTATFATAGNYVITATNTSAAFCNTIDSTSVKVLPAPTPGTIQGPATACTGSQYVYNMSTSAPSGYFYEWTISNGTFEPGALTLTTGNSVNVQWSTLSGTITVSLKQSSSPFCNIPAGTLNVTTATVGNVSGPTSVCVDGTGTYTLSGGNIPSGTNVTWSITPASLGTIISGQGTMSATVLWHGQGGSGPWGPATISATTTCGNAGSLSGVMIYPKFTMNITSSGIDICQGSGLTLTANGAPGGATYSWTPGSATTQTITNVTTAGTYIVTAVAGGCTATAQFNVPDPFAIIPVTCGVGFCNGVSTNEQLGVQVIKPASGTFTYEWHSGTCTSLGPILSTTTTTALSNNFVAPSDGNYAVVVKYGNCQKCLGFVVKKVCCPDVNVPQITNNTQLSCNQYSFTGTTPNPNGATITWDFGDGTNAPGTSGVPITHTYANAGIYCVTFCVGPPSPNPTSCTGNCAATQAIVPIAPAFTYTLGCNGCLNVTNTTAVYDNAGTVTYAWDFGDASTSNLQNPPQHCYASGGTYTVQLTVTFVKGAITCTKTVQQTVVYTPLSITVGSACTGTPIPFASSPGGFLTYSWTFGDGFTGYTSPISHAYNTAGTYPVSLSVTDVLGNTCTKNTTLNVLTGISSCTIQPGYICPGGSATLTAPAGPYTYLWEVETSPNVFAAAPGLNNAATYTTNVPGNYHVIVTNANGCTCTSNTVPVTAVAKTKASFSISPSKDLCSPGGIVSLSAPFITGLGYSWYVNNSFGSPVSTGPAYVTFVSSTTTFTLIDSNQYGCMDTCTMTVTVNPNPTPPNISSTGQCAGVPITLSVTNYASNISWNTGENTTSIVVYAAGTYVATYTDPVTGCSSSSTSTVNRRPSAGLFPHFCDSIPCKCSRPFIIYAPNPLIGAFASGYQVDWYNGITNAFLYSGNPYSNGGLGAQTGSYYVVITDLNTGCKDTSNKYSIVVPPCDTCNCNNSSWGEMILSSGSGNPMFPNCGGTYAIQCNKPYSFTTNYNCPDKNCPGKVTYSLQPPSGAPVTGTGTASFTPTQSGTYILTLYGWCGSKPCDSCIIKFTVTCPPCDCKASKWDNIVLNQGSTDSAGKAVAVTPKKLSCDKSYKLECNTPYSITAGFICKDSLCIGKVTYSLQPPSGAAITGTAPINFTPVLSGTYTLTLYGWCGNKICDSCKIRFTVVCGCDCAGSYFGDITLSQGTSDNPTGIVAGTPKVIKCDKTYNLDCKSTYSINTTYFCKDTACKGKVTYSLLPPTGPAVTGTAPLNLTPSLSGTYTLTLYGWCGDKICDSCIIKFRVDCDCDCKGSKWGEKILTSGSSSTSLMCKQYEWACNQPFTINATYNCAKTFCNSAVTYNLIPPTGPATTGSVPLNYTPAASGTYTVVLYGYCGGKVCDSCVASFVVNCPKDTNCCKYEIKVQPGTVAYTTTASGSATIANQTFTITGLTGVQLTEVRAEVLSYNISSNFNNECLACKMYPYLWASVSSVGGIGTIPGLIGLYGGTTTTLFNPTGTAVYQNPREVVWNNGTTFTISAPISMNFILPPPPLIDCCELTGTICVRFTFRDTNCNECNAIACFNFAIKK